VATIAGPVSSMTKIATPTLDWLREALQREHCQLHAYVLMTNHLLLTPEKANAVSRLIVSVGRRYVQYINHTYRRTRTLWDGRYKSSLVQAETYLLLCQRYIELNPIRARMVSDPGDCPWSRYRTNALGEANTILSPHALYLALAADDAPRREVYRDFFRTAVDDAPLADLRIALNQDQPLGNSRFYAEIEAMTGQRRELRIRGRPRKNEEKEPLADTAQPRLPI
jgi:putative transposase